MWREALPSLENVQALARLSRKIEKLERILVAKVCQLLRNSLLNSRALLSTM